MTSRFLLRLVLLALAFVIATVLVGWWGVPLTGAAWGLLARLAPRCALVASAAALLAWGGLLVWGAVRAPLAPLASTVGGALGVPGAALVLLTLAFAAMLAWAAARTAAGLADEVIPRPRA